jgi:diacylglycerol kinase (ATP)
MLCSVVAVAGHYVDNNSTDTKSVVRDCDAVVRQLEAGNRNVEMVDTAAARDGREVNGLAACGEQAPPLAIVPLGTANVLAHELGLAAKASAVARTITSGRAVLVHPGEASGPSENGGDPRCFSLMAGAGFDAKVVAGVSAPLKRRFGKAAYVWRSLIETQRYRPVRYAVEIDGACYEAASVIVTRSRHYAGPYVVAPNASLSEPLLHVCLFERWGRRQTLRFGLALLLGRLPRTGGYRVITGRQIKVSVLCDAGELRRQPVQIDGDDALTLPVSIGLASGAVRLLQPA